MSVALQGGLWRPGLPPGVYEERPAVARRARVRLDVAAFIGLAERGPVNTPVAIEDPARFERLFGRALPGLLLPQAVRLFFANGGRRCVVVRCLDHARVRTSRLVLPGLRAVQAAANRAARVAARNPGSWGNDLALRSRLQRRALPLRLEIQRVGGVAQGHYFASGAGISVGDTLLLVGRPSHSGRPPRRLLVRVSAITQGAAGRELTLAPPPPRGFRSNELLAHAQRLTLDLEISLHGRLLESWSDTALHPDHPRFLARLIGRRAESEALRPARWDQPDPESPAAEVDRLWGALGDPFGSELLRPSAELADAWLIPEEQLLNAPLGLTLSGAELPANRQGRDAHLTTSRDHFFEPTAIHTADLLADSNHRFVAFALRPGPFDPTGALATWDNAHPFEPAALISLPDLLHPTPPEAAPADPIATTERPCFASVCLPTPETATLPVADYPRLAFDAADLRAAQRRVVTACEEQGARIAMLDLPPGLMEQAISAWRETLASDRAVLYAPWLWANRQGVAGELPPSPAACGITAQVEREIGVWAAPANRPVAGVFGRRADGLLPDPGVLHQERIAEVRATERGLLLLGARTTSYDPQWSHLSVRRLLDWLRLQLAADLAWAPFEPNGPPLWSAMAGTASRRLRTLFDAGALAGRTAADSYFVRCDRSTHSDLDLDAGRALLWVGVAPALPAEFIVFKLVRHGADDPHVEALL